MARQKEEPVGSSGLFKRIPRLEERFRQDELIGEGAYGSVFKVMKIMGDEPGFRRGQFFAMKVVNKDPDQAEVKRVSNEIKASTRLKHPNILPVLKYEETDHCHLWFLPLIEGGDLRSFMFRKQGLKGHPFRILVDIARGLAYAHEQGIIHRDIKPENILMDTTRNLQKAAQKGKKEENKRPTPPAASEEDLPLALLTDFGLAKNVGHLISLVSAKTKGRVGCLFYTSPEMLIGDKGNYGSHTDVFELGVLAYELLAGIHPYAALDLLKNGPFLYKELKTKKITPLTKVRSDVPKEVASMIHRCMAFKPADRPSDAEVVATFEKFKDTMLPYPKIQQKRLKSKGGCGIFVLLALIGLAVGGYLFASKYPAQFESLMKQGKQFIEKILKK